ncbi:MAG: amidohydrolase family protein [Chloroflexota bacterium]
MSQKVDTVVLSGTIITMNEEMDLIPNGAVAISGMNIVALGEKETILAAYTPEELVDCSDHVLLPGLVNAHTHVPMTLLRGLNDDLRLDVWLGYLMPLEREFVTPDFVKLGATVACAEMVRSGITTFADMYYFESDIAETTAAAGLRALLGQTVLMFPSPDASTYNAALDLCREFIEAWRGHELIVPAVSPHAWYTATPELLRACADLALEYDVPLHTHISETLIEVENCRDQHGTTPVNWNQDHRILDTKLLAAHCVHIDRGEMRLLKKAGAGVAHNPTSNLKLSSGIAPVPEMLEEGINVGIGTDGPASNNDLDMFEEVRLAALLAKVFRHDPTDLPAREALKLATIGGARAVHMGDITGSLEVGKRADFITVDCGGIHNRPHFHNNPDAVYSRLVYASKSTDVINVMCNGRWLMREQNLLTIDEESALEKADQVAREIDLFVQKRESSPYNKLITLESVEREEGYETQIKIPLDDPEPIIQKIAHGHFEIVRSNDYRQFDHYFLFGGDDPDASRLRFREDHYLDRRGNVFHSRSRLTLLGITRLKEYSDSIGLSRTRFMAPATRTLRFYREYFMPEREVEVIKYRRRWRVNYKETDIAINIDQVETPNVPGWFLEIKARTWSDQDAEQKASLIGELLRYFEVEETSALKVEYVEIAQQATANQG